MATTNLGMPTIPENSLQPGVAVNSALVTLDAAVAGTASLTMADANYTLLPADYQASVLVIGGTLTAGRDVVFPAAFPSMLVTNNTGQTLTLKKTGQTGVALAATESVRVSSGVTDVVVATGGGGGGGGAVDSVNGATGAVIVPVPIIIACSDETTALTTGTAKVTFRMPYAFTLTAVRASVTTAPTGSVLTVDINEGGASILSTLLTIDATEKTSTTAATPAVISDTALADDAEITIDIDGVGSTIAGAGLKVTLIGYKS